MTPFSALKTLKETCLRNMSDEDAYFMAKYMKFNFSFYGIKTPVRREIFKNFYKNYFLDKSDTIQLVNLLWEEKERELHYLAMEILYRERKKFGFEDLEFLETLIVRNSWWDSIDVLSPKVGLAMVEGNELVLREITAKWIGDENIWLNRSAILLQLKRKEKTDTALLFRTILSRSDSNEFFIQKACGWALRELYKTFPAQVVSFIEKNIENLKPLTIREGLKHHSI